MCFAIVVGHLGYVWFHKAKLGIELGWSNSVFSVWLTYSYTMGCQAHSHLSYHCEAHSHLHYEFDAHATLYGL